MRRSEESAKLDVDKNSMGFKEIVVILSIYLFCAGALSANGYFWFLMGVLVLASFWLSFFMNLFMSDRELGKSTAIGEIFITLGIQVLPFYMAKIRWQGLGLNRSLFPLLWLRPYPIFWIAVLHTIIIIVMTWWYVPKKYPRISEFF